MRFKFTFSINSVVSLLYTVFVLKKKKWEGSKRNEQAKTKKKHNEQRTHRTEYPAHGKTNININQTFKEKIKKKKVKRYLSVSLVRIQTMNCAAHGPFSMCLQNFLATRFLTLRNIFLRSLISFFFFALLFQFCVESAIALIHLTKKN